MWVETKQRILDILKTLGSEPVPKTLCTIADFIPQTRSDEHGYMITLRSNRDPATRSVVQGINPHTMNFIVECTSPQVNLGLIVVNEYRIEAYADAVTALFDHYPMLQDPDPDAVPRKQALAGVSNKVLFGGAVFQSPRAFPQGGAINHYSFTMTIEVPYDRQTGC